MEASTIGDAFPFRLRQVERGVDELKTWRGKVDTTMATREEQQRQLVEKVDELSTAVDSLRKVIIGFALSIAGSSIVFALSVLIATGKIGH